MEDRNPIPLEAPEESVPILPPTRVVLIPYDEAKGLRESLGAAASKLDEVLPKIEPPEIREIVDLQRKEVFVACEFLDLYLSKAPE
jgi:hypothetical protein